MAEQTAKSSKRRKRRNRSGSSLSNILTLAKRIYFIGYRDGLDAAWKDAIETVRKA